MPAFQSSISLVGRICLGILFLWAGLAKLAGIEGTMTYMASKGMPLIAFFLPAAISMQILGALFIIPAALIFHDFWNLEGSARLTEQIMFMKDLGLLGGLLFIAAFGPGQYAFTGTCGCNQKQVERS
jgi:putative oxidoreductase